MSVRKLADLNRGRSRAPMILQNPAVPHLDIDRQTKFNPSS